MKLIEQVRLNDGTDLKIDKWFAFIPGEPG